MEKSILIAVDGSIHSRRAIEYTVKMSSFINDLKYYLLNIQPKISEFLIEDARSDAKARSALKDITVKNQENAKKILTDIEYCQDPYAVAEQADTVVVMTEWNEFRELDLPRLQKLMKQPKVVDARNIYDPAKMREMGFEYIGIGR